MSSRRSSPPSPQTSATSWSTLPSPATAAGAPSPVSVPHVVYPAQTDATAAPQAVPVCSRFAALRSSVLSPASSTANLSASNTPAKSVPALEVGTSLLDRRKPSPASPRGPKAATWTTATMTSAAAAACASHSSKTQHTQSHPSADADSVQGCADSGVGGVSTTSSLSAACAPQSASLTAITASSGKLYRPPHAREDSSKQRWSAGDGGGADNTATATDAGTTVSAATPTSLDSAAAVAGAAAVPTASSSSSPPPLRPSVSAAASKSTDALWWFPVSKANALSSTAPQRCGGSISAAPSSAVSVPATAAAVASGASPEATLPPPATSEDDQHGRAGKSSAVHSSVTATPREPVAAERREPTELPPKPSRSAKRKQKVRAMAAAAAAAAAAAEAEAEAEANRQPDAEVEVEVAAERREVVVAHPKCSSMDATSDRGSARIGFGAHSSPACTGSAPTKAAAAPNTSSVSRRPGWHPSFATSAAVSTTVAGEVAVVVAGDAEVVDSSGNGGPKMMVNGLSNAMPVSFAGALPSTTYAGQTANTMPGMSDAAGQLLPTEMATAGGGGGGNTGYMNGHGYQQQQLLRHSHPSPTQQYYDVSLLSQQQLQMAACGYYNRFHIASPHQQQQQQHCSHTWPSTSGVDLSSAAATTSPNSSSSTSAKVLLAAGAATTSVTGAAATMLDTANTAMSASGGGAAPPQHRAPGLHRGRGAVAAAAASQSTAGQLAPSASPPPAPAATGRASPSALLPARSGNLPSIRVGVSTTMNADSSGSPSTAATGGTSNFAAPRADTLSSNATAMGVGCTGNTMLNMASGMPQHHHYHHHTPSLAHPSSISGQLSQRPHQHHHQTMSLGSLSLDGGGGGQVNTTHHDDMESQSSMSPGAAQEHIPATISPHMSSRSQGGPSAAVNWGSMCGSNHGRSANAKHKGAASDCAHSRGSNSYSGSTLAGFSNSRHSGSRHGHTQQQAMMMNQAGNYMSSMYGRLPTPDQQAAGHIGSSGGGMMPMHHNALNVGGGGAGQQPMLHHQQAQQQQQQHTVARPPPIPYYDFITVLPTFVATCLTLKPEDEANREQLCWIIEAVLRKHLNQNAEIRVHGSITTGLALPSSDVDLLAVGYQPIAPLEALQRLSKALLELDEDSKNDALRLQELIEAEAQHRRRQLMEEAKKRAKQVALAAATGAGVAVAPDQDHHWTRESCCSASDVCEAASLRDSDSDADNNDHGRRSEENASEGEGASGLSPKRVACAGSIAESLLLGSTVATEEMPVMGEMDEAVRAAPNRRVSSHSRRSPCAPQDGTATMALQRSVSASSRSTESSTTCFSAAAFPLDTRKLFLTSSATVGDDDEFARLASGSGTVPGAGATSTCNKSGVGHTDSASASRLHNPDVATAEDTEVYGTVGDVEQAEEVFRGQIEKDYNFSTSVDLSALFAPSMGSGMPPVAPPVAAASGLSIGGASSSSSGLALQTATTRLHNSASLSSPRESAAASGSADLKGTPRSLPPAMTSGLHTDEDNIAAHAQPLPRSKAAPADADMSANEAELRCRQVRLADGGAAEPEGRTASGGGDAAAAEAEAAHAGTETVAADEAATAQLSPVSPTAAASGERAATVQTAAAPPASQDAVTRNSIVLGATDGRGRGVGHLTYVPVHEGPLFFVQSITATRVPVIKLTDKATGTKVDITFAGGEHWRSMQLTRSLLEVFPHARTLILFLKYCVRSLSAGESEPGGVTSFAIYLMVLHFYNECRQRILLLLRERNAASSSAEAQGRQAGADAGEHQHQHQQLQKDRAAEEALRRGSAADNSAASPAAPRLAAVYQDASTTAGPAPLTLGLLEYMLGEYLARVEQRHAQLVEEAGARRSASLDAAGAGDVAELYSSSGNIQKTVPALGRASSSTAVATGACATIKAAYASDDKERLRAIRQTILGFVGDPAAATTAAVAPAPLTTTGATPEKEGGTRRTQQSQPSSSDAAEGASGGGAAAGASSSIGTSTPSPLREQQPPNLSGTAGLGGTTTTTTLSAGEELAPVVDAAPGRLAPPPRHYLLKTVEPQPHERVVGEGSHVDTPRADEVAGRGEKVAEDTSAVHSTAALTTPETVHQETRADAAAAEVAEGTETPEKPVAAATDSAVNVNPVKAGQDAAGAHASRVAEAAAAAAASTSKKASEQHSGADSEDSAFDAFAVDFLRRQAEVSDLFLDFCHYYGCAFDYETSGIRFTADGRSEVVAKPLLCSRRGQHFHMTSPFDPEYDLTARMTHMRDFQWLCWWFAEWGAARQSPQYYGSCSLQYVLQCLSPMSADADCQAVHHALMKQAVAAARRADSTAAATLAQNHSMSVPMLAFQESMGSNHHMMLMQQQQQQSAPRQPHTMMMSMDGNTKFYGAQQQQQPQSMRNSTTTMMPMTLRAHPQQPHQQVGGVPVPPMNVHSGPRVEQQRCGGAGVAQHSVAAPFPHLQSMMMSSGSPGHAHQQQQVNHSEANGMDTATHAGGGGLGEHGHHNAPHPKYGGSISIASTAAKTGSATIHETAAIRTASSGSRSRPVSESGTTAAAAVSARTRARQRPPLQLPYVDSREEAFEGSSSHAATTPTAAGMMAVHSYSTEDDDDDGGGDMAAAAAASSTSANHLFSLPYGESPEGTWTSRTATTTTTYGGNSPRDRVDVTLTPVKGDEDEDEAGGRYGDHGYGSESVVDYTDRLDQCGGRGGASAVMLQHYPQQLAPHDAQATAEGNAGVGEHGAGGPCNGYAPSMAYACNHGYAASQQQQVSYGSPHQMNRAAGVYLSPQQQQQFGQQQEHAAAAAAFYYQAFAQQQQRQQQQVPYPPSPQLKQPQPIISGAGSGFVATAGTSSSSSYPFPALYYDLQQHLWQQQQQYHTTRNSSGFVGSALTAAADQDGGSSHRSDGTSSTTATSASAQQQQQQAFLYTPYVGYPSVAFGVGGTRNTDAARTAAGGGEVPQQQQQPDMVAMPSMTTYQNAAAVATGLPVSTGSADVCVSASEPPQQRSTHGGHRHPVSHHHSGGGDGSHAASQ
ncbi:conserved hypothetical protein [Leishmania major strain Friedlin]|uniref:Polymerase nucleotidyl transferase domain-containing protein n=1 Tax=Leishmania major TaxID=5664 RepID=O97205_LEIMA|nr:conserved hypothetical protein [Leishmania major strain Friedlin]CAC22701.1 conserved hypothetical protein [Leishmania major strain Friedlin]CAG9567710.1 Nucleotidyltransferase_domain_containing_protein_-_putative [Leishmania major strain Friedlin]|eukprot:XP_888584.1 conserved hypothetical protein [Leishmania major strain Friedlin]